MAQKVIQIPTLDDDARDFQRLFTFWSRTNGYFEDVRFDFSGCHFLRPNAVAFLGGLARLIESRLGTVNFDWNSFQDEAVIMNLRRNGFAGMFGHSSSPRSGTSIPYREDPEPKPDDYADYLSDYWLGKGWVNVTEALKNAIVERMLEIYMNAFEHSGTPIGVYSCGQCFPKLNTLKLTIVDFGLGIPANVRGYLKTIRPDLQAEKLKAEDCLRWAFQGGNTTRSNGTGRGLGLDLLKSFVKCNSGRMEVFSNEGHALITAGEEIYSRFHASFEGTLFHVTLQCDEKFYCLTSELNGL